MTEPKAGFKNKAKLTHMGGKMFRLDEDLVFYSRKYKRRFVTPAGTLTDLASIPWLFQSFCQVLGNNIRSAIQHDFHTTHEDVWRYLRRPENEELGNIILTFVSQADDKSLIGNLHYATAIARIKYWMRPEPLPETVEQHAIYWKTHYNSGSGAGTPQEYVNSYERFIASD